MPCPRRVPLAVGGPGEHRDAASPAPVGLADRDLHGDRAPLRHDERRLQHQLLQHPAPASSPARIAASTSAVPGSSTVPITAWSASQGCVRRLMVPVRTTWPVSARRVAVSSSGCPSVPAEAGPSARASSACAGTGTAAARPASAGVRRTRRPSPRGRRRRGAAQRPVQARDLFLAAPQHRDRTAARQRLGGQRGQGAVGSELQEPRPARRGQRLDAPGRTARCPGCAGPSSSGSVCCPGSATVPVTFETSGMVGSR